ALCPPSALKRTTSLNEGISFLYLGDVFTVVGRRMVSAVEFAVVSVFLTGLYGGDVVVCVAMFLTENVFYVCDSSDGFGTGFGFDCGSGWRVSVSLRS
ncbi:hypothetical protein A2U01_0046907, partial [Trifolium medium]|nr:hypothetical protein [Trifolium medium]